MLAPFARHQFRAGLRAELGADNSGGERLCRGAPLRVAIPGTLGPQTMEDKTKIAICPIALSVIGAAAAKLRRPRQREGIAAHHHGTYLFIGWLRGGCRLQTFGNAARQRLRMQRAGNDAKPQRNQDRYRPQGRFA